MKKRTKVLATILCMSMFAAMAMGSGSTTDDSDTKSVVPSGTTESASTGDTASQTTSDDASAEETAEEKVDVTIEEQILVDQNGVKVTATEYAEDSIWGDEIKILIENTTEQNLTFTADAVIVNDYMITDLFSVDVAAGMKANDQIYLDSTDLEAAGIENVGKVEVYFRVYDSDTWDDVFTTGPVEIDTSAYDIMDTTADDSGMELYNENGIRIVGKAVDENSFWGKAITLYIENTGDKNVVIDVDNFAINGFMIDPYFSTQVYAGKKDFTEITLFESDLEDNGIESIEDVLLSFHIYNADTYDTIADSDTISFSAR